MNVILGINGPYHELSACLLVDGVVACMIEEERLSRVRHAKDARIDNGGEWPVRAAEACLPVNFNVHPFYPSKRSLSAYPQHPRADQARLAEALAAARAVVQEAGARASLFVGLHDERHDQGPAERLEEMRARVNAEMA